MLALEWNFRKIRKFTTPLNIISYYLINQNLTVLALSYVVKSVIINNLFCDHVIVL